MNFKTFFIGGIACCVGEICTLPVDMVKVRLQCATLGRPSLLQTVRQIYREGGILWFWNGATPALLRIFLYCGLRLGFYEHVKHLLHAEDQRASFLAKSIAAAIAGATSAAICTPTDVIKTRMQAQEPFNRKYTSIPQAIRTIFRSEGIHGLYAAWIPTAARAAVIATSEIATYDEIKQGLMQQGWDNGPKTHLTASLCSGIISTFWAAPMDFLKTRMQTQLVGTDGKGLLYRNTFDCTFKSVRKEGPFVLWTGFLPHYMRRGPHLVITYLTLEQLLKWFNHIGLSN